jgi:hypothetical protein
MTFEKIENSINRLLQPVDNNGPQTTQQQPESDKKLTNLMYIVIPSICIPLIVLCVFLTFCYCRRTNKTNKSGSDNGISSSIGGSSSLTAHTKLRMSNGSVAMKSKTLQTKYSQSGKTSSSKSSVASSQNNNNNNHNNLELNPFLQMKQQQQQAELLFNNPYLQAQQQQQQQQAAALMIQQQIQQQQQDLASVKQFSANNIRFLQEIGKGRYGSVFIGELVAQTSVVKCVIKTLNDNDQINNNMKNDQDFVNEISLYSNLRHRNLSNLIGICSNDIIGYGSSVTDMEETDEFYEGKINPKCMIMEYLTNGDLHEYLLQRSCANQSTLSMCSGSTIGINSNISRNIHDFLFIAQQVAAGMEYLIKQNFVHKDLSARNIQMGDNLTIKICDLGQYKDKYAKDYYKFQNKLLPARWMSPESLLFGRYAQDTDVWSYGVLLWEIFNYACTPYSGCTNPEVIQMIRDRQLLMIPDECPQRVYQLMIECWHENSVQRPTFTDIVCKLKNWENYYSFHTVNRDFQPVVGTNMISSYSSNSQNSKGSVGNHTGSTAVSSTPTPPLPQPNVLSALPPLPNCYSPNRVPSTFNARFNSRQQVSPPSSTTSSSRIYREIESNTLRASQRPLLYATSNTATSTVTATTSNNMNLIPSL